MTQRRQEHITSPELRFPKFRDKWKQESLGKYFDFKNGVNADKSQYGSGHKFINILDIINDKPIFHDDIIGAVDISDKEFEKNKVIYGDILFQRSSEIRNEAGQSNVYLDKVNSATFGGFVIRGRPKKKINSQYFNSLLKTQAARKEITTKAGGSTRFNVGQNSLSEVSLIIGQDINEQQKIANFLTSVDEKINLLRRKHECLQTYKQGVMQKIFSQEIRFKKDDGTAFPDWEEKELAEVLEPIVRQIQKPSNHYLSIGVRSHMKGTFQKPDFDPDKVMMDKLFIVKKGDLVVNITFAWEGAIAVAKSEDDGGLVSHRFPTYLFKENLLSGYFKFIISDQRFKYKLDLISPGGAGRNRVLSKKDFLKIKW